MSNDVGREQIGHALALIGAAAVVSACASVPSRAPVARPQAAESTPIAVEPWARRFGGLAHEAVNGLAPDGRGGLWVAGDFFGRLDLDNQSLRSLGRLDVFVAYLERSGSVKWAVSFGGPGVDAATTVASTGPDEVLLGGEFEGRVKFGPDILATEDIPEYFLVRLESQGAPVWARSLGKVRPYVALAVVSDAQGNAYVNYLSVPIRAGIHAGTSPEPRPAYLAMLDRFGAERWRKELEPGSSGDFVVSSMAFDDSRQTITIVGSFRGSVGLGAGVQSSRQESWDALVARFDTQGGLLWERRLASEGTDLGQSVSVAKGMTFVAGLFTTSLDTPARMLRAPSLDADSSAAGYRPASTFLIALDEKGTPVWATNELVDTPTPQVSPRSPERDRLSMSWTATQPEGKVLWSSRFIPTCGTHQLAILDGRSTAEEAPGQLVALSVKDLEKDALQVLYFDAVHGNRAVGRAPSLPAWGTQYGIASNGREMFVAGSVEKDFAFQEKRLQARGAQDIFVARFQP